MEDTSALILRPSKPLMSIPTSFSDLRHPSEANQGQVVLIFRPCIFLRLDRSLPSPVRHPYQASETRNLKSKPVLNRHKLIPNLKPNSRPVPQSRFKTRINSETWNPIQSRPVHFETKHESLCSSGLSEEAAQNPSCNPESTRIVPILQVRVIRRGSSTTIWSQTRIEQAQANLMDDRSSSGRPNKHCQSSTGWQDLKPRSICNPFATSNPFATMPCPSSLQEIHLQSEFDT
jgi:hypothetical protein